MTSETKFSRIPARAAGFDLTATDWAVLHVICLHADKSGHAYPSLSRIASIARIRRNHVSRSTKRLENFGLLRSKRLARGAGWANTTYEIVFDGVAPRAGPPDDGMEAPGVAPQMVPDGTSGGTTGGTSDGALTYQLTDQATEHTSKEEVKGVLPQAARVTSDGDTLSAAVIAETATCRFYVVNPNGYRLCDKPAVVGTDRCTGHAEAHRTRTREWAQQGSSR